MLLCIEKNPQELQNRFVSYEILLFLLQNRINNIKTTTHVTHSATG